jgi:hypothetical protein
MVSHRIHRTQNLLLSFRPQNTQNAQNLLLRILPQNTQNAQNLLLSFFPTEYAELTEFTAEYSPTDFRCNFRGCTCLRSALPLARARSAPTKQTVILPQISTTQMVRVRIIKTTKYAHVKDGEVADSIAVEHNVLATFFPTLFHRRRTESNRTADGNRSDGGRNPIGRRTESDRTANGIQSDSERKPIGRRTRTMAHLGGALVSSAPTEQEIHQPSKNCANRARAAPTEQELHQQSKNCTLCKPHQ